MDGVWIMEDKEPISSKSPFALYSVLDIEN